jgi:hypothetical protein
MPDPADLPSDKGILQTLFGSNASEKGGGLMFIGWLSPATLDDFRQLLCDPGRVESFAEQLKQMGEQIKKEKEAAAAAKVPAK